MGENHDVSIQEMQEMLENIKDKKFVKRLHGIIILQLDKEQEESNIAN